MDLLNIGNEQKCSCCSHLCLVIINTIFLLSSCYSAAEFGAEATVREQPVHAEEARCEAHPEARPRLPQATLGSLEVTSLKRRILLVFI